MVLAALMMLIHVSLRVRVTQLAQEVDQLQRERQALLEKRQTLLQRVEELSSFGRIHQMAKSELDFVFPSTETVGDPGQE
jgi:cell division protein FtsL